ncbi:hypothetical protein WS91_30135 [Burkholderia sp. MSMB1498]|nr:hypothetical protein WS91_30135 [Burkholderia sp. MSMB1498]
MILLPKGATLTPLIRVFQKRARLFRACSAPLRPRLRRLPFIGSYSRDAIFPFAFIHSILIYRIAGQFIQHCSGIGFHYPDKIRMTVEG